MSVIYTDAWYDDLKAMINGSKEWAAKAPQARIVMALEVMGDGKSPYVGADDAIYYVLVLENGQVADLQPRDERPPSDGLSFRFTAPATLWEEIAAGLEDVITCGLRGKIKVRGDMRFLMQNADAVKILVDLYADQGTTEWPQGRPPY